MGARIVLVLALALGDGDVPHLRLDASEFDAGEVFSGSEITGVFRVRNEGKAALFIRRLRPC